ncbi:MAG: DUF2442 domain-containing protein [Planctomycetes bacterium]|nr:DUF2442 domain-containing protein [Planctomycetota bacterium]MBU4399244.1 DUF2442 domain-containing protein [Planctomycetota bacterium]MCG2684706.1 DUF2442 domain-containing protein [Planctomycetales bacterium]
MHYVTNVAYAGEYKLWIRFEDNEPRLVDLADHLDGPIFEPLKDPSYFQSFQLNPDIDTIVWPNNADFSPDFLYSIGVVVPESVDAIGG